MPTATFFVAVGLQWIGAVAAVVAAVVVIQQAWTRRAKVDVRWENAYTSAGTEAVAIYLVLENVGDSATPPITVTPLLHGRRADFALAGEMFTSGSRPLADGRISGISVGHLERVAIQLKRPEYADLAPGSTVASIKSGQFAAAVSVGRLRRRRVVPYPSAKDSPGGAA